MAQSTSSEGHGMTSTDSHLPDHSSNTVEMTNIEPSKKSTAGTEGGLLSDVSIPATSPMDSSFPRTTTSTSPAEEIASKESKEDKSSHAAINTSESSTNPLSSTNNDAAQATTGSGSATTTEGTPPAITRLDSVAIGPSSDDALGPVICEAAGPVLIITLLLTSGARHPYKIDEKYLTKRNVVVPETTEEGMKDPFSISVYTLKELILREWRQEWEAAPSSPSSIRLIYFGRLLDDKSPLKDCRFNTDTANVVHMTVRPQDIVDDEEASKGKTAGRDRNDGESTPGCRCVIL